MNPNITENGWKFTKVVDHQTMRVNGRAIAYGSYTECTAMRALVIAGLTVLCAFSSLVVFLILKG